VASRCSSPGFNHRVSHFPLNAITGNSRGTVALVNGIFGFEVMNKDRIAGSAKGIKGSVKEAIGKAVAMPSWSPTARPSRL
jgi:hypothetical protein